MATARTIMFMMSGPSSRSGSTTIPAGGTSASTTGAPAVRAGERRNRSISQVPTGVPVSPPVMIPKVAEVRARVPAPTSPASSSSGANASPVAGPPTSLTEPAITPINGFSPKPRAMAVEPVDPLP